MPILDRDRGIDRPIAGIECGLEVAAVERAVSVGLGQRTASSLAQALPAAQQRGGALGVGERLRRRRAASPRLLSVSSA
jgi:hypothetical protein